jgi:hypothetical protein
MRACHVASTFAVFVLAFIVAVRQTVWTHRVWGQGVFDDASTTDKGETLVRHLAGPSFLILSALLYNTVASRFNQPTVSSNVRKIKNHSLGAWIVGGIIGGVLAHWFFDSEV